MAILARSFRFAGARLLPEAVRWKQALLVVTCILAGCGGGGQGNARGKVVRGPGYSFSAPVNWSVRHVRTRTLAAKGAALVQIVTFPLARPYTDALYRRVEPELATRMRALARATGGRLSDGSSVTVGGIRSHSYRVEGGGHVDEYTFVLRGRREFQLLCRRTSSGSDAPCRRLLESFRLT